MGVVFELGVLLEDLLVADLEGPGRGGLEGDGVEEDGVYYLFGEELVV